jgi:high affinity sulfate transporter 1
LPAYDRRLLRFDVIAGVTIWGLLVPEMIAYAGLAGLPPQAGLYTLLVTLAAYAVFGTSRHLVAAGTSAAAVLMASGVAGVGAATPGEYAADAAGLVLLCAGLFLLAGFLRLGFIAQFLSTPVIDGFIFGLAIFVIVKQLPKLFGIPAGAGDTLRQLGHVVVHLGDTNGPTLAVGVAALAILMAGERFSSRIPGGLLVLGLGIAISAALDLSAHGVDVVGTIPSGLPSPVIPDVPRGNLVPLLGAAAGMLLVIYSESLGAAETFAAKHGYDIRADQELIALGVANAGSGLVGGLAGGGSLSQSAVNESAGARSELSPLVATVLIVATLVLLTPLFKDLPEAVLAALIIHAVARLMKVAELRRYAHERRVEFWLALATLVGVITIDVLPGLVIGVAAMLLLVVYDASRPYLSVLGQIPGVRHAYGDVIRRPQNREVPGLLLLRLEAPLFYANARPVASAVKRRVGARDPLPRAVVLDVGANADLDITSSEMLDELVRTLRSGGVDFALAGARSPIVARASRTGLLATIGEDRVFHTIDQAVEALAPA